jgi:hypothetical protein
MFLELANHNEYLKNLLEKGYAITEDQGSHFRFRLCR